MDMRTDSTAVPHAGLSENLRNQDRCQKVEALTARLEASKAQNTKSE